MSHKSYPIDQSPFYALQSRTKLASIFGLDRSGLDTLLAMESPFSKREITLTRNGKTKIRVIQEPRGDLRLIHTKVRQLLSRIEPPGFLFCPVKRRSYVGNAAQHIHAREVCTLDVKNYFPSTPSHRVFGFFHKVMRCSQDVAAILTQLLTVDKHLATGSTVSPILSFFAFYNMWLEIAKISASAGCIITVYIDDITVSGNCVPDSTLWAIKQQLHSRGLRYHKERRYTGRHKEVTGVLIIEGQIRVPNRQKLKAYKAREMLKTLPDCEEKVRLASVLKGLNEQRKQVESFASR
jgi:Reverse transcriptase (RNA-dependent DNA polymerase)